MAQIFKAKKVQKTPSKAVEITIEKLDHQGLGLGRLDGKAIFVAGALPGERVSVNIIEQKKQYAKATLRKVLTPSEQRIEPACPHYATCGGCSLQTLACDDQADYKQTALFSLLQNFSKNDDIEFAEPILSQPWQYRRTARLSVMFDRKAKKLAFGFRERNSKSLVSINECPVLEPALSALIQPLRQLLATLTVRRDLGHIELFAVDSGIICLFRILKPLNDKDLALLQAFASEQQLSIYLQPEPESVLKLTPDTPAAWYQLADGEFKLSFTPGNFIQVNPIVNNQMVEQAINWLELTPEDKVLDLFCGGGNFSLPIARLCHSVVGVEGVDEMVRQAQVNAAANNVDNAKFYQADLSADFSKLPWAKNSFDKVLLDPARAGAAETVQYLHKLKVKKIVYVSCNPATLARDSKLLMEKHYKLTRLGMIDMFPQTGHVESMALFERV
ncbi:23S rRNA (uracil(1939)-C(5))-methyltransferase RlmD [Moritella sp. 24]|uniref:23S rRNA (uracil(1939)-C(5))-methyltransferase RlmD n=1 Tax=Moritella sp. 24 TaxID=2746230 RepID=UPI001BA93FFE|nr:23S rRNA (uracil(1939)-C(5))-methyltransferase RlmD [Moritella sp. 24]QUM75177.1 23S rRNA (uracil(1939)-C(5))-methyltransferase RlmD [Moritella sp. 24]